MTEDLKKLLAEATPGPWVLHHSTADCAEWEIFDGRGDLICGEYGPLNEADAKLMALAPEIAARLVQRLIDDKREVVEAARKKEDESDDDE